MGDEFVVIVNAMIGKNACVEVMIGKVNWEGNAAGYWSFIHGGKYRVLCVGMNE